MSARSLRLGCLGVALASALAAQTPAPPDFSGSWELNSERSDDPAERVDEAMRGSTATSRGGPGARARGTSDGAGGRQAVRAEIEALVGGPRVITIRHDDPELVIESALPDRPLARRLYTDGREFPWLEGSGEKGLARAGWRLGGRLVIELTSPSGRAVEETWELVAEGSRVLVATELAAKGLLPAIRVQRVYDRVEIIPWAVPD